MLCILIVEIVFGRKSQAKKVVCIPAPAPANSRPSSGEVVPSDLWAWRKYGQKPIKGSPYPRSVSSFPTSVQMSRFINFIDKIIKFYKKFHPISITYF